MPELLNSLPKVAIFSITRDRLDYTRRMLSSLKKYTHQPYDLFVVDNGSGPEMLKFLINYSEIKRLLLNSENKGISIAWNQALNLIGSGYDYIIKIDNDCEILTDNWLSPILTVCQALNNKAVLSPYVENLIEHKGGVPRYAFKTIKGYRVGLTSHLGGIVMVAPVNAYEGFRFNEKLPLKGNQDVSFCVHLKKQGFLLGYLEEIKVSHIDGTLGQQAKYPSYFANRKAERWLVPGEHPLIARIKKPFRRWLYLKALQQLKK